MGGGGLSNILLAKEGSLVIELNKDFDVRWHFYRISRILGIQHRLVISKSSNENCMFLSNSEMDSVESIIQDWETESI